MLAALNDRCVTLLWDSRLARSRQPLRFVVMLLRFVYALTRDILVGQLTLRAMSLVYTTILSVVPLLAIVFAVLKGFGAHYKAQPLIARLLEPLGEKGAEYSQNLADLVNDLDLGSLAAVAIVFLIYTALSLIGKVDDSFNYIWRVQPRRDIARRFGEYLSVLLIGPLVVFTTIGLATAAANSELVQQLSGYAPFGVTLVQLGNIVPYPLIILGFSFFYSFIPNAKVHVSAALIGGTAGGLLWFATGSAFARFVASSARYTEVYSTFAIPILALIWLYLCWLILLLGAQISFYVQNPRFLALGRTRVDLDNRRREKLALTIMYLVGRDARNRTPAWTADSLANFSELPRESLTFVLRRLGQAGILLTTADGGLMPGRDTDAITLRQVLNAVRSDIAGSSGSQQNAAETRAESILSGIDDAVDAHLAGRTLRDLIGNVDPPPG